jgi:hypothetical protein
VLRGSLRLLEKNPTTFLDNGAPHHRLGRIVVCSTSAQAYMRTPLVLSASMGVILIGLLLRFLRRMSSHDDAGSVSGQWIAERSVRGDDQAWP